MSQAQPSAPQPSSHDARLDAAMSSIRARHATELDPASLATAREAVARLHAAVAALDAYPLTNADEPDPVFTVFRGA